MKHSIGRIFGALLIVLVAAVAVGWFAVNQLGASTSLPPAAVENGIPAAATPAVVEYVHDGDTLFLEDGRKVRMLGIDTPEIGENLACYGEEATALLRELLPEGTPVWVLSDVDPTDQYDRALLFIYTDDGTNVNLTMLERGAAQVEMYSPNVLMRAEIEAAERTARDAGLGLWGQCR